VTPSSFSRQTQEEVLEDQYPAKLVAGADLVRIMRETRVARGDSISPAWLRAVKQEVAGVPELDLVAEEPAPYGA
jgi:hypothetical protein